MNKTHQLMKIIFYRQNTHLKFKYKFYTTLNNYFSLPFNPFRVY
jgi:hypothetical protein